MIYIQIWGHLGLRLCENTSPKSDDDDRMG